MSAQPQYPEKVTQLTDLSKPMEAMKALLNENGEMDLANLNFADRMQQFREFEIASNCNLPLWSTNLLTQFPAGTTLLPLPIMPGKRDAWRGDDAKKMNLKPGHVEPAAEFIIRLGQLLAIDLKKVFEGPTDDTGVRMYSVRYIASLMLPNGAMLTTPDAEGKDQVMFTGSGTMQAHIVESTRKKAKRNAIRELLGISISMPEEEFDRPWILLRRMFREGVSEATDRIITEQRAISDNAKAKLYGGVTIDVQAEKTGEFSIDMLRKELQDATTKEDLDRVSKLLAETPMNQAERKELGEMYQERKKAVAAAGAEPKL